MEKHEAKKTFTRSKTGCLRCKEKRLKCDETKPSCLQCQKRQVPCPEYQQGLRWSDKYEVYGVSPQTKVREVTSDTTTLLSKTPSLATDRNPRRRASSPGRDDSRTPTLENKPSISDLGTWDSSRNDDEPAANIWDGRSTRPNSVADHGTPFVRRISSSSPFGSTPSTDMFSLVERLNAEHKQTVGQTLQAQLPHAEFPLPQGVTDESSDLLIFYFNGLCRKNSVFDGPKNPFRWLIVEWMNESPLILNCVLSMSARALVARRPDILQDAVRYHTAAVGYLTDIITNLTQQPPSEIVDLSSPPAEDSVTQIKQAVLASILLGISSSWLEPSDLGVQHLLGARKLLSQWQKMSFSDTKQEQWMPSVAMSDPEKSFIIGALAYWEALIAFVIDQPLGSVDYLFQFCDQSDLNKIHLNGWTGICTPLFVYLAKVAILVRQKRLSTRMVTMGWNSTVDTVRAQLHSCAIELERLILAYKLPPRSKLYETEDPQISLTQLENMAHCYQLASLLELYRAFPEILTEKLPYQDAGLGPSSVWASEPSPSITSESCLTQTRVELSETATRTLVFHMATSVIDMMSDVPVGTGLSYIHTLGMIISGSTLSSLPLQTAQLVREQGGPQGLLTSIAMNPVNVAKARDIVRKRMRDNATAAFMDSFGHCELLLREVWDRLDAVVDRQNLDLGVRGAAPADEEGPLVLVHWLDVMIECRLETVYG